MTGMSKLEGAYQRFGSMINTTVLLIGFAALIWNAGADAEKRDAADRENAARIVQVERDTTSKFTTLEKNQADRWTAHEELHKNRLADVKAVEARGDERIKSIEADVRKLSGMTENLNYRQTSYEQVTNGLIETVKEIQRAVGDQSGDLREIKVILQRIEKGQKP